jgi:hypothetical protein
MHCAFSALLTVSHGPWRRGVFWHIHSRLAICTHVVGSTPPNSRADRGDIVGFVVASPYALPPTPPPADMCLHFWSTTHQALTGPVCAWRYKSGVLQLVGLNSVYSQTLIKFLSLLWSFFVCFVDTRNHTHHKQRHVALACVYLICAIPPHKSAESLKVSVTRAWLEDWVSSTDTSLQQIGLHAPPTSLRQHRATALQKPWRLCCTIPDTSEGGYPLHIPITVPA